MVFSNCIFIFYSWWDVNNLPILLISILCNWFIVNAIWQANKNSDKNAKNVLLLGLIFNISYLGCFKYYDFIAINLNEVFGSSLPRLILLYL